MIYSMTAFASGQCETEYGQLALELRSLNHRYLDVTVHVPRRLQLLESEIKEAVGRTVWQRADVVGVGENERLDFHCDSQ